MSINCPSCAADLGNVARFAHMVVCAHCQSAVVVDKEAASIAGAMAALAPSTGPLSVGLSGSLKGRHFTVLGRVRYGYEQGFWDEWFLELENGETVWIGEDERNFMLERPKPTEGVPIPAYESISLGERLILDGKAYHVDEINVATCEGGEGQLPFKIISGETVPFVDLSAGQRFATLEYDDDDVRLFLGARINPHHLKMDAPYAVPLGAPSAGPTTGRRRVTREASRSFSISCRFCGAPMTVAPNSGDAVPCDSCGQTNELGVSSFDCPECGETAVTHGDDARIVVCGKCDKILDVSGEPKAVGAVLSARRPQLPVSLGQVLHLRGEHYYVVGHIRYMEEEGFEKWYSDEFLLHGDQSGYRWLLYEDGHYSFCDELDERPDGIDLRHAARGQSIRFDGKRWKVFERCDNNSEVVWVDGELPWVAMVGDRVSYLDLMHPPYLLSAEWTATELEWYCAEYLQPEEIATAMGVDVSELRPRVGVAPHQPYGRSRFAGQSVWVMLLFSCVFGFLGFTSCTSGERIKEFYIKGETYKQEYLTGTFTVSEAPQLCKARLSTNLSNQWIYLDAAVVDEQDRAIVDFSLETSYYSGVEGGERWSEGHNRDYAMFRIDEPGDYRLLLLGQYGDLGTAPPATIRIESGAVLMRYYLVGIVFCLIWIAAVKIPYWAFEAKRWGTEGDDDDDD